MAGWFVVAVVMGTEMHCGNKEEKSAWPACRCGRQAGAEKLVCRDGASGSRGLEAADWVRGGSDLIAVDDYGGGEGKGYTSGAEKDGR